MEEKNKTTTELVPMADEEFCRLFFGITNMVSRIAKKTFVLQSVYDGTPGTFTGSITPLRGKLKRLYRLVLEFQSSATAYVTHQLLVERYEECSKKICFKMFKKNVENKDKQHLVFLHINVYSKSFFISPEIELWDYKINPTQTLQQAIAPRPTEKRRTKRRGDQKLNPGFHAHGYLRNLGLHTKQ